MLLLNGQKLLEAGTAMAGVRLACFTGSFRDHPKRYDSHERRHEKKTQYFLSGA